tara:strand:+ start:2373 stop:4061 length:1689 start_codon:yes stop_codon:yes gene_type:complete
MCGIEFSNDLSKIYPLKTKIINSTNYRGPDQSNFIIKEKLFFGFNYLSITGSFKGSPQPFLRNGNILIFNGEIYNYLLLKKELLKKNIKFKTDGDTEVLSACLEYYGIQKTHKLIEGMWSFIYYDAKKKNTIVSRDRLGIKPLFFSKNKNFFHFSSSIETLRKFFAKGNIINNNQIINFIKRGNIFERDQTIYKTIKMFPAGNYCQIIKNNFKFTAYWKLKTKESFGNSDYKLFQKTLKKNISKHNNYDVKTAIPLSSGIDSNFLLSNFKKKKKLICYSLKNFENDNESNLIKTKLKKFKNIRHKFIDCKKLTNKKNINNFIKNLDYPIRSFQPIYQFFLRKQAKQDKVKILLSGDGADEIFGGYKYAVPYRVSSLILKRNIKDAKILCEKMQSFTGQSKETLLSDGKLLSKKKMTLKKFLEKRISISHIPYWLYIDDFVSMKNSIENRVPFLDSVLVEHLLAWKEDYFFRKGKNKFLLRKYTGSLNTFNQKFHKPGNYSVVYTILSKDIKKILVSNYFKKNESLKKLYKVYDNDLINKNIKNSDLWFRVYLITKWIKYKKI